VSNVAALVETNAATTPERIAIVDDDVTLSYRDLCDRTDRMVGVLRDHGVTDSDRVAIRMRNRWEFFVTSFAAWALGAITVPVNTRLRGDEVGYILDDSGAVVLVTERELDGPDSTGGRWTPTVLVDELDLAGTPAGHAVNRLENAVTRGGDVQRLMYTSGTTSRPKAVVITHRMVVHNMLAQIRDLGLTGDDRLLVPGPLFHVAAFDAPGVAVLFLGGTIFLRQRFHPAEVLATIDRHAITGTVLVHPMGDRIVETANADTRLESLRWLSVGARSPLVARRMTEIFPNARLVQGYGLTEACGTVTSLRDRDDKAGTVGSPVAFVEIGIVDDAGQPVPNGDQGEVVVRGPKVSPGYWGAAEYPRPADGWLPTGDIGCLDRDGFLRLIDRKKDMIRSGGENVASSEIERVLAAHDGVRDCAVVAAPDERWGEVPVAFVVRAPGTEVDASELDVHCDTSLARFKRPARYHFLDDLPRNATGKIRKVDLRQLAGDSSPASPSAPAATKEQR